MKYINYVQNIQEETFILYYSFPLIKTILNDYNNFIKRKKSYYTEDNESTKGNNFEAILKVILRNYYILPIDGYFEVENLIKMDLINIYTKIDNNYFLNKNIIFINQINRTGKLYDLALYYAKEKNLILFQVKYIIKDSNVKHKNQYLDSCKEIKELFKKKFDIDLNGVYLLYISDRELNNNTKCSKILKKNELNCLFFSIQDMNFTFDFLHIIQEIKCEESFRIIPEGEYINKILEFQKSYHFEIPKRKKYYLPPGISPEMTFNLETEYQKFITYVKNNSYIDDGIKNNLGDFLIFSYVLGDYYEKDNKKLIYYLTFSVKKSDDNNLEFVINYNESIGLAYYNDGKEVYLNLNKDYKTMAKKEFKTIYYYKCLVKGSWKKLKD